MACGKAVELAVRVAGLLRDTDVFRELKQFLL